MHLLIFLKGHTRYAMQHVDSIVSAQLPDRPPSPSMSSAPIHAAWSLGAPDHVSAPCMEKDANQHTTAPSTTPRSSVRRLTLVMMDTPSIPGQTMGTPSKVAQSITHMSSPTVMFVPYNLTSLPSMTGHINVEIVLLSRQSVIPQVCLQGSDRATVQIGNVG